MKGLMATREETGLAYQISRAEKGNKTHTEKSEVGLKVTQVPRD
jgi:hypothetical protein